MEMNLRRRGILAVMIAVSACTLTACLQTGNSGTQQQQQISDPNQSLLQLIQHRTLAQAIKDWDNKCEPQMKIDFSCDELNLLFMRKCRVQKPVEPIPLWEEEKKEVEEENFKG